MTRIDPAGIREPAVAGHFYSADPAALRSEVTRSLGSFGEGRGGPTHAVVVPHAGYLYSGDVAGATYAVANLPRRLIVLGPNHTGRGRPIAVMDRGAWRTPLGLVPLDGALAGRIMEGCAGAAIDAKAHAGEHSLEVQLPFLQVLLGDFTFVPICVGTDDPHTLSRLGMDLARVLGGESERVGLVISSDMSHYIPADEARRLDMLAVERMEALDPEGLDRIVRAHGISMCGHAPAVAGLAAARGMGARECRLIRYANSGDTSGDYARVVGYAGLAVS